MKHEFPLKIIKISHTLFFSTHCQKQLKFGNKISFLNYLHLIVKIVIISSLLNVLSPNTSKIVYLLNNNCINNYLSLARLRQIFQVPLPSLYFSINI